MAPVAAGAYLMFRIMFSRFARILSLMSSASRSSIQTSTVSMAKATIRPMMIRCQTVTSTQTLDVAVRMPVMMSAKARDFLMLYPLFDYSPLPDVRSVEKVVNKAVDVYKKLVTIIQDFVGNKISSSVNPVIPQNIYK